jgi:hypothetical protein
LLVTFLICPDARSRICALVCDPSPGCGDAARTKSSDDPSGDQLTGDAGGPGGQATGRLQRPDVRRFASPPLDGTVQIWLGITAAWMNRSSFSTSNESLNRSGPFFASGSSSVTKANVAPSGDHAYCCTPFATFVTRCASPPPSGMTKI